jgi:hypothetical protein
MDTLTPAILADLWKAYREGRAVEGADLAGFQKFMVLHEDFHGTWDRLAADPSTSLEVDGENVLVHIAMDTATERALEENQPPGLQALYGALVQKGLDEGQAFHVLSQAMQHEFLESASAGREMDLGGYFRRAADYCRQAMEQAG